MDEDDFFDFQVFRGLEGLKSLEKSWRDLANRVAHRAFYHEYDWFRSHLESLDDSRYEALFVMACAPGNVPVAIFPLQLARVRKGLLTLTSLRIFWPQDMDVNDFIMDNKRIDNGFIRLLTKHLKRQHGLRFDLLEFQSVPERSNLGEFMKSCPANLTVSRHDHCSKYVPLGQTYDETTASLSGKFKRNLRRKLRKLETLGEVEYTTCSDPADLEKGYETFLEVEANSWKGSAGTRTAIVYDEQQTAFYRELLLRFGGAGQYRIDIMTVSGVPVAAQLGIISGDTFYLLKIAYHEAYKCTGPGSLLLNRTLEFYSRHRYVNHISFVTDWQWIDDWAPRVNRVYSHSVFSKTSYGVCGYVHENLRDRLITLRSRYKTRRNSIHARVDTLQHAESRQVKSSISQDDRQTCEWSEDCVLLRSRCR